MVGERSSTLLEVMRLVRVTSLYFVIDDTINDSYRIKAIQLLTKDYPHFYDAFIAVNPILQTTNQSSFGQVTLDMH